MLVFLLSDLSSLGPKEEKATSTLEDCFFTGLCVEGSRTPLPGCARADGRAGRDSRLAGSTEGHRLGERRGETCACSQCIAEVSLLRVGALVLVKLDVVACPSFLV